MIIDRTGPCENCVAAACTLSPRRPTPMPNRDSRFVLLLALCTLTAAARAETVTLVTGDRVTLGQAPEGRPLVGIEPATRAASFQTLPVGGPLYVIPQGAPVIADIGAFDVPGLLARGSLAPPSAPAGKLYTLT